MPSEPICAGCHQSFSISGLASHLRQTRNPPCKAIFEAQNNYIPAQRNSTPDSAHFVGDFFGENYEPDDFDWDADPADVQFPDDHQDANIMADDSDIEPPNSEPPDSDVDEGDAASDIVDSVFDFDAGWEPPPLDQGLDDNATDLADLATLDADEDVPQISDEQRSTAHDALRNPPYIEKFNDKYADAQAGACMAAESDTNTLYQTSLHD